MSIYSIQLYALVILTLVALFIVNKISKRATASNIVLLISSMVFIGYASIKAAIVIILTSLVTYLCAKGKKIWQKIGIVLLVFILIYFKYTAFFLDTLRKVLGGEEHLVKIILPLGLSFYIFNAISYLVDVMKNKYSPQSLLSVLLYLSYFPKLICGPLVRAEEFIEKVKIKREVKWEAITAGAQVYLFGLFKKIVLADHIGVFVDEVFNFPLCFNSLSILFAVFSYSLQIYFDFSGYTDMAIGISKMLGIVLPINFNLPYLSHNIKEFWKRWHITLSRWIQDYIYIPLGGSRKKVIRTYLNLFLTMSISGLWHGAGYTYIAWGALHGVFLILHRVYSRLIKKHKIVVENKVISKVLSSLSVLLTFCLISFLWVFFRATSIKEAINIFTLIFSFHKGVAQPYFWSIVSIVVLCIASIVAFKKSYSNHREESSVIGFYPVLNLKKFWQLVLFFSLAFLTLSLCYTGGSPFIYATF